MVGHKERREVSKHVVKVKMDSVVDENTAINLGGENVECRIANIGWSPYSHTLIFHESKTKHVLTCLQRHINSFPRYNPRVQLELDYYFAKNSTAHSSIIENVKDTHIKIKDWDTSQIEEYLKCHEFHESLQMSFKLTGQGLNSDSKLTNVKGLTLYQSGEMTSDILEHFSGQYLVLFNSPIQQEPWRNLILKWKRGEKYQDLKAAHATTPLLVHVDFDRLQFLKDIGAIKWDGLKRPKKFKWDRRIVTLSLNSRRIDCSDWLDIQQDDGGKWASIKLDRCHIWFFVWD